MDNMTMEEVKEENCKCGCGRKYCWGVLAAIVFLMMFWVWLSSPLIVSVTGSGEVSVPASSASLSLTVSAGSASPQEAISQIKNKALSLRRVLQSSGIEEKEIMEAPITVVPAAAYTAGASGFQASLTMGAKTLNLTGVDELVSQLYASGATIVSQPVLSADKQVELEAKALDEAMKDAKKQVNNLARKNFKLIKKVIAIQQASSGSTATATSKTAGSDSEFKIAKAVQVSYKMW